MSAANFPVSLENMGDFDCQYLINT